MAGLTMSDLRRREVIGLLGGAAAWPITAGAQQANILVIGYLSATSAEPDLLRGFHQGLKEGGAYVEGDNVAIDYRWPENGLRLPRRCKTPTARHIPH
jgi:putative tryptophan/tyrosine transport system substrate-binding protein